MSNQVFEQIEVITHFHNLEMEIIKFKWRDSVYNVSAVNSRWKIPWHNSIKYHFSVICTKQNVICELSYFPPDFLWELIQYDNL